MTPKDIIKELEARGFLLKRINGSHHIFQHTDSKKVTVVPMHKKDLPKGTLHAILKQSGIERDDLRWTFNTRFYLPFWRAARLQMQYG